MNCPLKKQMQLNVAVEELFVNIANYAYNVFTSYAKPDNWAGRTGSVNSCWLAKQLGGG